MIISLNTRVQHGVVVGSLIVKRSVIVVLPMSERSHGRFINILCSEETETEENSNKGPRSDRDLEAIRIRLKDRLEKDLDASVMIFRYSKYWESKRFAILKFRARLVGEIPESWVLTLQTDRITYCLEIPGFPLQNFRLEMRMGDCNMSGCSPLPTSVGFWGQCFPYLSSRTTEKLISNLLLRTHRMVVSPVASKETRGYFDKDERLHRIGAVHVKPHEITGPIQGILIITPEDVEGVPDGECAIGARIAMEKYLSPGVCENSTTCGFCSKEHNIFVCGEFWGRPICSKCKNYNHTAATCRKNLPSRGNFSYAQAAQASGEEFYPMIPKGLMIRDSNKRTNFRPPQPPLKRKLDKPTLPAEVDFQQIIDEETAMDDVAILLQSPMRHSPVLKRVAMSVEPSHRMDMTAYPERDERSTKVGGILKWIAESSPPYPAAENIQEETIDNPGLS